MISRVLIANRGEIAVRIAKTCRALGIETVAVYSDADRKALHVLECDRAVHIGGSALAQSYLNIERIIEAARESGADALHPGYGLLSENPALAEACVEAGITFIGPPAQVIQSMGDKTEARHIAQQHGVPTVPGYDGSEQDNGSLMARAQEIGFPVMVKAAAGGGGRGMRVVSDPAQLQRALDGARREADRAFGNGALLLERAIVGGRHVEVQVLADAHGNVVHLGERDCSVQRRHQKVIEESPSPAVDDHLRWQMGDAAVRLAQAVGYVSAGTVEFMLDADRNFYFLEMNTRLQVEHGVTELRTGLDIVGLQVAIANGERLPFGQDGVRFEGHAIECRVYAEDPIKGYLPSPGRITRLEVPTGDDVRNDIGTYEGDEISTYYDPMISKLLTHGRTREEALLRMADALSQYRVEGVKTNLGLLRTVVTHPVFRNGGATTDFLDTQLSPEALGVVASEEALLAAFGLLVLGASDDPWHAPGPLRAGGAARLDLEYAGRVSVLEGQRVPGSGNEWTVVHGRERHRVRFSRAPLGRIIIENRDETITAEARLTAAGIEVVRGDRTYQFSWSAGERQRHGPAEHRPQGLVAPMPGLVLKVLVKPGQKVRAHQPLVVLEAMKMEHSIEAPHDGVVKAVHCAQGGRVSEGAVLVELEQDGKK